DRLSVPGRNGGAGYYKVTVQYSTATEDQLRSAGSAYPDWLDPYRNFGGFYRPSPDGAVTPIPGTAYRSKATLQHLPNLAPRVEAYFPSYGWIPFEPTPDGTYFPIPRGTLSPACPPDSEVCNTGETSIAPGAESHAPVDKGNLDAGDTGNAGGRLGQSPVPGGF